MTAPVLIAHDGTERPISILDERAARIAVARMIMAAASEGLEIAVPETAAIVARHRRWEPAWWAVLGLVAVGLVAALVFGWLL